MLVSWERRHSLKKTLDNKDAKFEPWALRRAWHQALCSLPQEKPSQLGSGFAVLNICLIDFLNLSSYPHQASWLFHFY